MTRLFLSAGSETNSTPSRNRSARADRRNPIEAAARSTVELLEVRSMLSATPQIDSISVDTVIAGNHNESVTVVYSDDDAIDPLSVGPLDITVTGPEGPVTINNVTRSISGGTLTAVYRMAAPGGIWSALDNGNYSVTVNDGQVDDFEGQAVPSQTTSFIVSVPDAAIPTSAISAPDVSAAGNSPYSVVVTYTDAGGIDTSTIDSDDLGISGPGGTSLNFTSVAFTTNPDGTVATATYTFDPAGGTWEAADSGTYTVALAAGSVKDSTGNAIAAKSKTFDVDITTPDTTGPTTAITAGDVSSAATSINIVVQYDDDGQIDGGTIDTADLTVTGPNGTTTTVASVSKDSSNGGKTIVATYKVTGPGGHWTSSDNGTYTVSLAANAVADKKGNGIGADSDTFKVSIDGTGPQSSISAPDITAAAGTKSIKVTYTDDHAVDVTTIGKDDLSISGPSGSLGIDSVSTDVQQGGKKVVATYTLSTPAGGWIAALNGTYSLSIAAGAVTDSTGNPLAADSNSFAVNIPLPDTQDPTATISPVTVIGGSETATVTIVYADDVAVRRSTIGTGDITVAGPAGALSVRSVSVDSDSNARTITATYTVAGPGGSWDIADNGHYTVTLNAGEVTDTSNHNVAGASSGFDLNIVPTDTGAPVASIAAIAGISAAGANDVNVSVTYTDDQGVDASTIGADDISVTGPAGTLNVSSVVANSSGDGKTINVTYTISAPAGGWTFSHDGTYTVTVKTNQVRDVASKPADSVSSTFTVNVASPEPIDGTFGGSGGANASFVTESITTQSDGTILLAGHQTVNGTSQAVIQRLNAIGAVDASFGNGGTIVVSTDGSSEAFYAVTMQGNKILVGGTLGGDFLLARYNLDGTIDASFQGGKVVTEVGGLNDTIYGIALAPDGSIVAAGGGNGNFAFAKYTADGAADLSFSPSGALMFQIDGVTNGLAGAVAVMPDGRIVAAGAADGNVAVIRLRTDGFADTTFSGDGLLIVPGLQSRTDAGLNDHSQGLALQTDGKLLVSNHDAAGNFAVARIDASGNVDSSFGSGGLATADFGGDDDADALLIQDTGEILAIGTSLANGTGRTGIAAFNSSGNLITGFGTGGMLTLNDNLLPAGRELHVGDLVVRAFGTKQNDGRVVVGSSNGTPGTSALRRLIVPGSRSAPTGSLLGTFGLVNGKTQKLSVTDAGKTTTFSIKGGTGSAFVNGDKINLVITDAGAGTALTIKVKGGNGRLALGDVTVNGTLKTFSAKTADLSGTLSISAAAGKLTLGEISGTIAAGGSIASLTANNLNAGSRLLAGIGLGTDRKLGGTSGDADSYAAANIGSIKIGGSISQTLIAAGLNPGVDGTFGNDDDQVVGGTASFIKSISVKGTADDATKFVAGSFKSAKIGKGKLDLATDERFRVR